MSQVCLTDQWGLRLRVPLAVSTPASTNAATTITPTTIPPRSPVNGAEGKGVDVPVGEAVTVQKTNGVKVGTMVGEPVGPGVDVPLIFLMISVSPG